MKWTIACAAIAAACLCQPAFAEPKKVNDIIVGHLSEFNKRCLYDYRLDPKSLKSANISALIKVIYRDESDKVISDDTELLNLKKKINSYYIDNGSKVYFVGDLENKSLYRDLSYIKENVIQYYPDLTAPEQFFSHIKDNKKPEEKFKKLTESTFETVFNIPYEVYANSKSGQTASLYIENDCNKAANVSLKSKMNISIPFVEMKYLLDSLYDNQNNRKIEIVGFDFASKAADLGIVQGVLPPAPDKVDTSVYLALWDYYTKSGDERGPVIAKSMRGIYIFEYVASEGDVQLDINLKSGVYYGDHRAGMGGASFLKGRNRYKLENQDLYFIKSEDDHKNNREQHIDELTLISAEVLKDRLESAIVAHEAETNTKDQNKSGFVEVGSDEKEIERVYGLAGIPDQYCSKEYFNVVSVPENLFSDSRFRISRDDKRFGCLVVVRQSSKGLPATAKSEQKYELKLLSAKPAIRSKVDTNVKIPLGTVMVKTSTTASVQKPSGG